MQIRPSEWKIYLRAGKFFLRADKYICVSTWNIFWSRHLLPSIRSPLPPQHNPPPSLSTMAVAMAAAMATAMAVGPQRDGGGSGSLDLEGGSLVAVRWLRQPGGGGGSLVALAVAA